MLNRLLKRSIIISKNFVHKYSTKTNNSCKELKIPTPWGHLAAKDWGPPDGVPVLAVHGWQDNAGSFDLLQPYLPENIRMVALDLSGHGLSSHRPLGTFYGSLEYLQDLRKVVEYLQWNNFTLMAHSMGGLIAVLYAVTFPTSISNLITIEYGRPSISTKPEYFMKGLGCIADGERQEKSYSYEEIKKMYIEGSENSLNGPATEALMRRGVEKTEDGKVKLRRDFRVTRHFFNCVVSYLYLTESAYQKINCNYLAIIAKESAYSPKFHTIEKRISKTHQDQCKNFKLVEVDGTHHLHLTNPALIMPYITKFFNENSNS